MKMTKRSAWAALLGATLLTPFGAALAQDQDTLVVAQSLDAYTMDPAKHSAFPTANILFQMYDALITVGPNGEFLPALATGWSNPDPLTWRFTLREGVTFHNGEPFNAEAVKFTFDRALDPDFAAPYYSRISAIKGVEVVDEYTVDFKTDAPYPTMLFSLNEASFASLIVPPVYVSEDPEAIASVPIGTGPYKFVEWLKDNRVVMEVNADYWGEVPEIERVIFRPISEVRTRIAELTTDGVDIAVDIPPEDVATLEAAENTEIVTVGSDFVYFFAFDTTRETPLQNKLVRQAINYAVDVDAIQEALLSGLGNRIALTLPTNAFGYDPDWEPYPYDPEMARELLAEAGYPDGFTIPLTSRQGRYMKDREIMEATIGFLSEVGITVEANYLESGVWAQISEAKGREGLIFPGWSGRDPDLIWYPILRSGMYQSYFSNSELDELLEAGRSTLDPDERLEIYAQAAEIIKEEAPHLPIVQPPLIYGIDAKLDWAPRGDSMINLRGASFE